jgi:XisI protein
MDSSLEFYKQCVKKLLSQYESLKDENSKIELIFDDERMHYMALWIGWHEYKRIHQCAVHIDIVGDRIFIECNDTEDSLVAELLEMGISKERIHLSFIHPKKREYIEQEAGIVAGKTS